MRRSTSQSRHAPFIRIAPLLLACLLPACAFHRIPPAPTANTAPPAVTPPPPCDHAPVDQPPVELDARSINHIVDFKAGVESLTYTPRDPGSMTLRSTSTGLTAIYRGDKGITGRWAGWRGTERPVQWNVTLHPDGTQSIERADTLYDVEGDTLYLRSDRGALFSIFEPDTHAATIRGVAIIITGLDAGTNTDGLVKRLTRAGWVVAQIYNLPLTMSPPMAITYHPQMLPEDLAAGFANIFEDRHCTIIGATRAALELLEEQHPHLATAPRALIGLSAGAIYAPAVNAALDPPPDSAVLVAGGTSMFRILHGTWLASWGGDSKPIKEFLDAHTDEIDAAFLAASPHDPHHLAPLLPRGRTLLIHARDDGFVPALTGDALYERAGRPERWIYPGGHAALFLTFHHHADDITEWLDANTPVP